MRENAVAMLNDTLYITMQGAYDVQGQHVLLQHSPEQLTEAHVFLPQDVHNIVMRDDVRPGADPNPCEYFCENADSFSLARRRYREYGAGAKPILVLNMANPVHPGGGVRRGARAQEEDLCRKSSLLLSLESDQARPYYEYNRSLNTYMGSDAIILSPTVDIIRDGRGDLLTDPVTVAVLTCAAPMITAGLEGMTKQQYRDMFYTRILSVIRFAACQGYRDLVLGAWGCGAFGNDAALVSDLFAQAFRELRIGSLTEKELFRRVDFAVLCGYDLYNYEQFARNFDRFRADGKVPD